MYRTIMRVRAIERLFPELTLHTYNMSLRRLKKFLWALEVVDMPTWRPQKGLKNVNSAFFRIS